MIGVGLNLYDVMSVERLRGRPRPLRPRRGRQPADASSAATSPSGAPSATA